MEARRACELCEGEAAVHCESDSAFLCWACDAAVHGANFLVARHRRRSRCPECGTFDVSDQGPLSGATLLPVLFICHSCHSLAQDDASVSDSDSQSSARSSSSLCSSTSSSHVSSAESGAAVTAAEWAKSGRRRRRRAASGELDAMIDVVLANWCRRLGLEGGAAAAASHALLMGTRRMPALPLRVIMATAVWFAARLRFSTGGSRRGAAALLRLLEECSGVPVKLISMGEAKLSRALRRCHVAEDTEGWAECS
ncbi:unnamed protein product [Spirodela intermedia]|uniref:B box-type domain-containing protein n=1 Tax=Spirodela intermedia TaxID=51605 RepID=A0A7I8LEH6_SPIIN|nr:unnamed protein product [Spirodela intermedia]